MQKPYLIHFPKIGDSQLGYISVAEKENLPFKTHRVYWAYFTPENVTRGFHAHHELEQILIAAAGKIIVHCELLNGEKMEFILESPSVGLFIPKYCWHTMKYTHNSVQVCIANMEYKESDYVRNYDDFKNMANEI